MLLAVRSVYNVRCTCICDVCVQEGVGVLGEVWPWCEVEQVSMMVCGCCMDDC